MNERIGLQARGCVNCGTRIFTWGVLCGDCVRAFVAGLAAGLAAWVGELLFRR
jgi:hypothetical protein